ncbi:hypothetical protein Tco_0448808 [Tanacetum coccineum]
MPYQLEDFSILKGIDPQCVMLPKDFDGGKSKPSVGKGRLHCAKKEINHMIPIGPTCSKKRLPSHSLRDLCPMAVHAFMIKQCPGHVPKGVMVAIFHDRFEENHERYFMDDFSVFCVILSPLVFPPHLDKMLQSVKTPGNLVLIGKVMATLWSRRKVHWP